MNVCINYRRGHKAKSYDEETKNFYILLAFWLITIALLINKT